MNANVLALIVSVVCLVSLLPFTLRLGRAFGIYIYRKYFYREDIYVIYKERGLVVSRTLIRKNADGSISQFDVSSVGLGKNK